MFSIRDHALTGVAWTVGRTGTEAEVRLAQNRQGKREDFGGECHGNRKIFLSCPVSAPVRAGTRRCSRFHPMMALPRVPVRNISHRENNHVAPG